MSWILRNVQTALVSLRDHRQRAVLSALGITVGSMAIVLLVSIARGVQEDVKGQVEGLGVNLLIVVPFRIPEGGAIAFNPNVAGISYLKKSDVPKLRLLGGVRGAVPWVFPGGSLTAGSRDTPSLIVATPPDWFRMREFQFSEGGPFGARQAAERVCVLGELAKQGLFGSASALGKSVRINGEDYRVVGVTRQERKGGLLASAGIDNMAFIPFDYIDRKLEDPPLSRIIIQSEPSVEPKALIGRIEKTLEERLERDNFSVVTQEDLQKLIFNMMGILTALLFGLTSIALFVGGVGIMTVMLMSVGERAKEIGIRKTVGARTRDIFVQFLTESVLLALMGGLAGLVLSYLACLGLYHFTLIKPIVSWTTVALSFSVSVGVGAVFGLSPAIKAARQDPVASLRHD